MFQKKIIDKYLSKIDRLLLADKYSQFETIFSDKQKQENENLAKLKELKADVALKLKSLNAKNKIANKYAGNIEPQEGSILDFSE